jgi:hypothetical protein
MTIRPVSGAVARVVRRTPAPGMHAPARPIGERAP